MIAAAQSGMGGEGKAPTPPDGGSGFFRGSGDSREHHTPVIQFFQELRDIGFLCGFGAGKGGHHGSLCQIGQDYIRPAAEGFHGFGIGFIQPGIQFPVICHGRICNENPAGSQQGSADSVCGFNGRNAPQIPGVYGIKGDPGSLPVIRHGIGGIGQMGHHRPSKAAGVGGQQGGGKDTAFMAAGAENGQRHRHGALPHTGDVLYGENSLVSHFSPPHPYPDPAPGAGIGGTHSPR